MSEPTALGSSAPAPLSAGRRRAFRAIAVALSVLMVLALTEIFFRLSDPPPRVAVVRGDRSDNFAIAADGTPIWRYRELHVVPCTTRRPTAPRITFVGSSITYGVSLSRDQALASQIEQRLLTTSASPCADNMAEPGFGTDQEAAVLRTSLAAAPSALVVWEVWDPSRHYSVVGDFAFDGRARDLDARGVPETSFVPEAVADPLFRHSAAYRYATLALVPRSDTFDEASLLTRVCDEVLPDMAERIHVGGGTFVLLQATPLDRPLALPKGPTAEETVASCARTRGIQVFSIAQILADQSVEDVRLDPCCHLNARGHALLAERLAPKLAAILAP